MLRNYTHYFHPYPAKFPPEAIRSYIKKYTSIGENVIDPFCGSGTTLVECRVLGRNALGLDLNPVGVLISKSKSDTYNKEDIRLLLSILNEQVKNVENFDKWLKSNSSKNVLPSYPERDNWFQEEVIDELSAIKSDILDKYSDNKRIHDLLLTAFSRIIVPVSNQDKETRYAKVNKNIAKGDTLKWFIRTLKSYYDTLANQNLISVNCNIQIIEGNTLKELPKIQQNSYDLAITSPPYINSFDYYLYHKHRISLLGKNPRIIRELEIGGHHTIDHQTFDEAFNEYYSSIKQTFGSLHDILKQGKKFVLFIGDGIVKGKTINISKVMNQIGEETGFQLLNKDSIPLSHVSKGFIKNDRIKKKKHHVMIFANDKSV